MNGIRSFFVAGGAGQSPFFCPSAIAIHDDGNGLRNLKDSGICCGADLLGHSIDPFCNADCLLSF